LGDELAPSRPDTPDSAVDTPLPEPAGAAVADTAGCTTPEGPVAETDGGAANDGVRASVNGATVPAVDGDGFDSIVVAGLVGADELSPAVPVVDDVGAACFGPAPAEAAGVELDAESECVPAGLVGGVRCLVGPTLSERVVVDPDAMPVLVLTGGVLPVVPVLAWAIPDPLASAAPTPRVRAPAPSQVDVWLRRCWAARWRAFTRLAFALARLLLRCVAAMALSLCRCCLRPMAPTTSVRPAVGLCPIREVNSARRPARE
jgi:hypothetical protein